MPKEYRIAGERNKSIGYNSTNTGSYAIALGASTTAPGAQGVAVGQGADAIGNNSISIGNNSTANNTGAVVVGNTARAGLNSVAIGNNTLTDGTGSVGIGSYSNAAVESAIVINASGSSFPEPGFAQPSNVYISSIYNLGTGSGAPSANVITYGTKNYGLMYCNVETGHIMVIGQSP